MRLKIKRVSPSGKGILVGEDWFNRAKNALFTDFKSLKPNDEIEAVVDEGKDGSMWVKDFTTIGGSGEASSSGSQATHSAPMSSKDEVINRQSAVKSVMGSPLVAEMCKTMDSSQAVATVEKLVVRVNTFLTTGKFPEVEAK